MVAHRSGKPLDAKTSDASSPGGQNNLSRRRLLGSAPTVAASMVLATLWPRSAISQATKVAPTEPLTAIDTLLDPDQTMVERAVAANTRLRQSFPKGFALGETHQPHISMLQRYVRTSDLDKVYDAVAKVLADEHPAAWKLTAYKYYFIPWKEIGLAGIVIKPTDDLRRFQQKLIDAIAPFTAKTGTAAAFVTTKEDPNINKPTIEYVARFVPEASGAKFNPHVTIGVASQDYLKKLLDEKFDPFTFSPTGLSVFHLGNFGTAREKLKSWSFTRNTAEPSIRTGLSRRAPKRHVFHMLLEGARRRRAAFARRPAARNEAAERCIVTQMFEQTSDVAAAIALGILHLPADLGAALAEPDELHRRELPVDAGAQRRRCRIVRQRRGHVTGRAWHRLGPDTALPAMDVHAVRARLGFTGRRPDRDRLGIDVAVGATRMRHHRFNALPRLQPIRAADAALRQHILLRRLGRFILGHHHSHEGRKR